MPKIKRENLPDPLIRHLLLRAAQRSISEASLLLLRDWLNTNPEVPHGPWGKLKGKLKITTSAVCPSIPRPLGKLKGSGRFLLVF